MNLLALAKETVVVSAAYVAAFFLTYELLMPVQDRFFPQFPSRASLLFLPHGVRVLSAWLLGWRSVVALLPGVFIVYLSIAGADTFTPSRLFGILVAVTVPALVFHILKLIGRDQSPAQGRTPCWPCIMTAGVVISVIGGLFTSFTLGGTPRDYIAYLIGDTFGLFFLMLGLMYSFRLWRRSRS